MNDKSSNPAWLGKDQYNNIIAGARNFKNGIILLDFMNFFLADDSKMVQKNHS